MIDPLDSSTWPKGDKIWEFCRAIALAEGYGADPKNAPTTHHNPGDLGPGDTDYPGEFHGGSYVSQLPDDEVGFQLLYRKIHAVFAGESKTYSPQMTFVQFAHKYAGDWQPWVKTVTRELKVKESTTLMEWFYAGGTDEPTK